MPYTDRFQPLNGALNLAVTDIKGAQGVSFELSGNPELDEDTLDSLIGLLAVAQDQISDAITQAEICLDEINAEYADAK